MRGSISIMNFMRCFSLHGLAKQGFVPCSSYLYYILLLVSNSRTCRPANKAFWKSGGLKNQGSGDQILKYSDIQLLWCKMVQEISQTSWRGQLMCRGKQMQLLGSLLPIVASLVPRPFLRFIPAGMKSSANGKQDSKKSPQEIGWKRARDFRRKVWSELL